MWGVECIRRLARAHCSPKSVALTSHQNCQSPGSGARLTASLILEDFASGAVLFTVDLTFVGRGEPITEKLLKLLYGYATHGRPRGPSRSRSHAPRSSGDP